MKAERKELSAWLYGHIDYLDVFDEPHVTTFCALYWPFESTNVLCDRHNEIDPQAVGPESGEIDPSLADPLRFP